MKLLKTYLPMIISILFFMSYTMIFTFAFTSKMEYLEEYMYGPFFMSLLIIFMIEFIYFFIHSIRNKKIKNQGLWIFLIYQFNVFVIPYYNFKYRINIENVKEQTIIYIILSILSIISSFLLAFYM